MDQVASAVRKYRKQGEWLRDAIGARDFQRLKGQCVFCFRSLRTYNRYVCPGRNGKRSECYAKYFRLYREHVRKQPSRLRLVVDLYGDQGVYFQRLDCGHEIRAIGKSQRDSMRRVCIACGQERQAA